MARKATDQSASKQPGPAEPVDLPADEQEERQPESAQEPSGTGFPVVGIGASAGGLGAFEAFFAGLPVDKDPGMAFVLVQHLAPDHTSILAELVRRYTSLQVYEVVDGMAVAPNCIYIIPPNRDIALDDGTLRLVEPAAPRGQRLPVDHFFRSLARAQRERAICVVLSGSGSDGTQGLRAIKGEGGMVMAQDPDTTDYDGMTRSAIATGLVDYILPPARMAAQLMAYVAHAFGHPPVSAAGRPVEAENALKRILALLRTHTGHDFAKYKMNTVQRRIERRMAVHQIGSREEYAAYLRQAPAEIGALFHDLLIGVTSFFRDPVEFRVLEDRAIPRLFAGKALGGDIRVWCPGCSTGEEAYSIAILLQERLETLRQPFRVQVFATDIDPLGIAAARAGVYPASVASDLSPERLGRFFTAEPDGSSLRIHKNIRDMLVFSEQDLIRDPPFSRLDLISCRNLLIYMGSELQRKLIPLFHYALNPGGFLFQGTSESIGDFGDLFTAVDRKAKLFQRKEVASSPRPTDLVTALPRPATQGGGRPALPEVAHPPAQASLRGLTEHALLQQLEYSAALVDEHGDLLYLHGRTGQFLEPSPGEVGASNILKMAREGLAADLGPALRQASQTRATATFRNLRVKTNGGHSRVNLSVRPVPAGPDSRPEATYYLVVFELVGPWDPGSSGPAASAGEADQRVADMARELRAKEEYLKASNEQLETSNEELKSSNEEMQSVNEELQSTNEELETSKEELQSVNEELATVNAELQTKVLDLSRANNDMNNLLAGTGIATIFVDHQMRLLRFTPAATNIINLIGTDVGRPVGHIVSNLVGYDRLVPDLREVLEQFAPKETEVQTSEGKWYSLRIQLYRTLDNVIEGAVITFVDITERKRTELALGQSESLFRLLAGALPQLVWTWAPDGLCDYVSPRMADFTGMPETLLHGRPWLDLVHGDDRDRVRAAWETGAGFEMELRLRRQDGGHGSFSVRCVRLPGTNGLPERWLGMATASAGA